MKRIENIFSQCKLDVMLIGLSFLFSCSNENKKMTDGADKAMPKIEEKVKEKKPKGLTFNEVKAQYKTLIPVSNGYFITHTKIDSAFYHDFLVEKHKAEKITNQKDVQFILNTPVLPGLRLYDDFKEIEKWGLIDSVGNVLVPFVCDAISEANGFQGFSVSIFSSLTNLNTGMVRYIYSGKSFQVSSKDWTWKTEERFTKLIEGELTASFHNRVISSGPNYFKINR